MSSYDFGSWDPDSSSFFEPYPAHILSPDRSPFGPNLVQERPFIWSLSPSGLSVAPLPDVTFQEAPSAHISYPPSPVQDSPIPVSPAPSSPVLRYPSPAPSPVQSFPTSEERSTIHAPTPRAQSLPPSLQETFDATGGSFDSPIIDYKASARRILSENLEDIDLQIHFGYPPPRSDVPIREETPEEVGLQDNNDENTPPAPIYRPPSCINLPDLHPHQYHVVQTERGVEWRVPTTFSQSIQAIPSSTQLTLHPPVFPGVTPFRSTPPHFISLYPLNAHQALVLGIPPLHVCSQAIIHPPAEDTPLGYIQYTFRIGIKRAFDQIPILGQRAYEETLVVLEVLDFLDGHVITQSGYLSFGDREREDTIYIIGGGYQFEDGLRAHPTLSAYTFFPHIPADPFDFISVHRDEVPL